MFSSEDHYFLVLKKYIIKRGVIVDMKYNAPVMWEWNGEIREVLPEHIMCWVDVGDGKIETYWHGRLSEV